ncbi:MAG: glycosyltransferase family 87 protein [Phycisphaerae bacterium]
MPETRPRRRWPLLGLGVLLGAVGAVSFTQAAKLDYDFRHFYLDAAYVWQHGQLNPDLDNPDRAQRRQLPFYLPAVALLLSPLTAGGAKPAALLWTIGHLVSLAYTLKVLASWRAPQGSRAPPRAAIIIATVAALPVIYEAARFNQVSFFVLALVLAGAAALERRRPTRAGVWLGLATAFKLLPGIFALWLLLKRQWTALATLAATVLVVALLPCLIAFGPRDTARYHRQWWNYNVHGAPARGMVDASLRSHFIDHRNQSIPAVLARLCWPKHPQAASFQPFKLDERTCRRIARGLAILLVTVLIWMTRRPVWGADGEDASDAEPTNRCRREAATYLLAMLVFSPLLRTYYLVWALPGLVLLTRFALDDRLRSSQRLGLLGFTLWLAGMLAWMSDTARAYGVHLIMLIALAGILLRLGAAASAYNLRKIRQAL